MVNKQKQMARLFWCRNYAAEVGGYSAWMGACAGKVSGYSNWTGASVEIMGVYNDWMGDYAAKVGDQVRLPEWFEWRK